MTPMPCSISGYVVKYDFVSRETQCTYAIPVQIAVGYNGASSSLKRNAPAIAPMAQNVFVRAVKESRFQ